VLDLSHLRPGQPFRATVRTFADAAVVLRGAAPDLRPCGSGVHCLDARRGQEHVSDSEQHWLRYNRPAANRLIVTAKVPHEGLPLLETPHKRGCLAVKLLFALDELPLMAPAALRKRDAAQSRAFETVLLRARRRDHGVGGRFVFGDAFQPRNGSGLPAARKHFFRFERRTPGLAAACRLEAASVRVADPELSALAVAGALEGPLAFFAFRWAASGVAAIPRRASKDGLLLVQS